MNLSHRVLESGNGMGGAQRSGNASWRWVTMLFAIETNETKSLIKLGLFLTSLQDGSSGVAPTAFEYFISPPCASGPLTSSLLHLVLGLRRLVDKVWHNFVLEKCGQCTAHFLLELLLQSQGL